MSTAPVSYSAAVAQRPGRHRYLAMLKTKAGEITALSNLPDPVRDRIMPVFHIGEEVKPSFAPSLVAIWAGRLVALDGSFNFSSSGSTSTFMALLIAMRSAGTPAIPCWNMADPPSYQTMARAMVDMNGAAVKVSMGSVGAVHGWLQSQNLSPAEVDLIVDMKHIGGTDVGTFSGYARMTLSQNAQLLGQFRSVTLAAAAAPKDHGSLALGANRIPRLDWQLWSAVHQNVGFTLDYGDYLTGHPDLTEPPGAAMAKATVSARYTLDSCWLIIKGRSTGGPYGIPMGQQYQAHAGIIANDPGFVTGSPGWADSQISQAAAGAKGMGSRAKWSGYAANRHISLVVDRLP